MRFLVIMLGVSLVLGATLAWGQVSGDLFKQGQEVYQDNCAACHRGNGEGLPPKFPSLKGSAFVQGDAKTVLKKILFGEESMPAWQEKLNDQEIAAAATYIRNAWGNKAPAPKPEDVAGQRKK
jgi:cytochrome c oxidase subunit 2